MSAAYRTKPDTSADIAADLARLIAGSSGIAARADQDANLHLETILPAPAPLPPLTAAMTRRRERFGSMTFAQIAAQLCGGAA